MMADMIGNYQTTALHLLFVTCLLLSFSTILGQESGQLDCSKEVWGEKFSCCDITCPPGYSPVMCADGKRNTSSCELCDHLKYSNRPLTLSENGKCKMKINCEQPGMMYSFQGDAILDAKCDCIPGFRKVMEGEEGFTCEEDRERNRTGDGEEITGNDVARETVDQGGEKSYPVPGYVIVIIAMAIGIGLMILFWCWTPCNSCSQAEEGSEDEQYMLEKENIKQSNFSQGTGSNLNEEQQKKVVEYLLYNYLPKTLTMKQAVRVSTYLFKDYNSCNNLPETAQRELTKKSPDDLRDRIKSCFKRWREWRGKDVNYVDVIDSLRYEGLDFEAALNEIHPNCGVTCEYHIPNEEIV